MTAWQDYGTLEFDSLLQYEDITDYLPREGEVGEGNTSSDAYYSCHHEEEEGDDYEDYVVPSSPSHQQFSFSNNKKQTYNRSSSNNGNSNNTSRIRRRRTPSDYDAPPPPLARVFGRRELVTTSLAFLLILTGVLFVHRPIISPSRTLSISDQNGLLSERQFHKHQVNFAAHSSSSISENNHIKGEGRKKSSSSSSSSSSSTSISKKSRFDEDSSSESSPKRSDASFLRAYNEDYGEVKPPTARLYRMDMLMEPYRETTIEVLRPRSDATYTFYVAQIDRKSEELLTLYDSSSSSSSSSTSSEEIEGRDRNLKGRSKQKNLNMNMKEKEAGNERKGSIASTTAGTSSIIVMCTAVGEWHFINVTEQRADGSVRSYQTNRAACRYVRREIRQLTDADREAYLDGLEVVHRTTLGEGRDLYGAKFNNYEAFTAMHNSMTYCYHGGDQFITTHAAFTQMMDESLQAQNPAIISPYWDFMIDSFQLGTEWYRSIVYSDSWFGSVDNTEEENYMITRGRFAKIIRGKKYMITGGHFSAKGDDREEENYMITRGRFAKVPVAYDPHHSFAKYGPDHNTQGYVANHNNLNAAPYVQRTRHMCGIAEGQRLATCSDFASCFDDYSTLEDWTLCMEVNVHANMHEWHGGAFGCAYDLREVQATYPQYGTNLLLFLGTVAHDVWYIYTNETIAKYMSCPLRCSTEEAADANKDCACSCGLDFDTMDDDELVKVMQGTLFTLQFIFFEGRNYLRQDDETGAFIFSNGGVVADGEGEGGGGGKLTYEDHLLLLRITAKLFCQGGLSGPLGTGAASNDPIFWPMHPIFDRAWHLLLLSNKYNTSYDMSWTDGKCYGSAWEHNQVFTNLLGDETNQQYTNAELWDLFSPHNENLPYIYDDFSIWGGCSDWDACDGAC